MGQDGKGKYHAYVVSGIRALIIFDYLYQIPVYKLPRKFERPEILEWIAIKKKEFPHLFHSPRFSQNH